MRSRLYVGKLLDADNELDAITRRQSMSIVHPTADSTDLRPRRDWKFIGAVVAGVIGAAVFVGLLVGAL